MSHLQQLFPALRDHNGPVDHSRLEGKVIGVYFSAHWCPPCRGFTPFLAGRYEDLKNAGKSFEIVYVSSDRSEAQFDEYYLEEMPWLAVPYGDASMACRATLGAKWKVKGIPTLVLIDEQGNTITTKGRQAISNDPSGANFPWHPPTLRQALANNLCRNDGQGGVQPVAVDELNDKYIGVYFSASWCPPCQAFSPVLVEVYNRLQQEGKQFEVVFVSSDKTRDSFAEYFGHMPWLAVTFANDQLKGVLSDMFDVQGIPRLVMVGPDDQVINSCIRSYVMADQQGAEFPWRPRPVNDLSQVSDGLNDGPCLIAFLEAADDEEQAEATNALTEVATAHKAAGGNVTFFTSTGQNPIAPQIKQLCSINTQDATMVLIDIPDRGAYYVPDSPDEFTVENISEFIQGYQEKTIARKAMRSRH